MHRPWGWYDSIDSGPRFQVKRIMVKPGASLSLQKHHHRAEHWIVVSGTAEVTNGDKVILLHREPEHLHPARAVHRSSAQLDMDRPIGVADGYPCTLAEALAVSHEQEREAIKPLR